MFKDLRVVGLGASASYQSTFGSSLNPLNLVNNIRTSLHPATRDILNGFDGVVRPGEMLRMFSPVSHTRTDIHFFHQSSSAVPALAAVLS